MNHRFIVTGELQEEARDGILCFRGQGADGFDSVFEQLGHAPLYHKPPLAEQGLRLRVLTRDGFSCVFCGRSPATEQGVRLDVDHKIPFSTGGDTTFDNLQTLCQECNRGKGNAQFQQ